MLLFFLHSCRNGAVHVELIKLYPIKHKEDSPMTDMNNTPNIDEEVMSTVMLSDDEGNEAAYDIADFIEMDGNEYVVLVPQDEDDEEVVILRVEEEDEETEVFVTEDNEEILEKVFETFKDRFEDEYEFTDAE